MKGYTVEYLGDGVWEVINIENGHHHVIHQTRDFGYVCDCDGWFFRKKCAHINEVNAKAWSSLQD